MAEKSAPHERPDDLYAQAEMWVEDERLSPTVIPYQAELMRTTLAPRHISLGPILAQSLLAGHSLPPEHYDRYSLTGLRSKVAICANGEIEHWNNRIQNNIQYSDLFLDTPTGVGLTYDNNLIALVGLSIVSQRTAITKQIQGVRQSRAYSREKLPNKGLARLDWTACMVTIAEQVADSNGCVAMYIQGAQNNRWAVQGVSSSSAAFSYERALEVYDHTADRCEYVFDEDSGNWAKII